MQVAATAEDKAIPAEVCAKIQVQSLETGESQSWTIAPDLSDRWGEIHTLSAESKVLLENTELQEALRAEMWDEITFFARKDGQYGLLWEVEYLSQDSDPRECSVPYETVVANISEKHKPLLAKFPSVQFGIPDKACVYGDRPAIWAFMPLGALTEVQREELGNSLLEIAYP